MVILITILGNTVLVGLQTDSRLVQISFFCLVFAPKKFRKEKLSIDVFVSHTGFSNKKKKENKHSNILESCDKIFLVIFTIEILLKWYHSFKNFWKVGWNVFDFVLVFVSIVGDGLKNIFVLFFNDDFGFFYPNTLLFFSLMKKKKEWNS